MALGLFWATVALSILIAVLAADIMGLFGGGNHFDVDGRVSRDHIASLNMEKIVD